MKLLFIDFEFHSTNEAQLDVVSVAYCLKEGGQTLEKDCVWLYDRTFRPDARDHFKKLFTDPDVCIVAYVAEAEARALLSLGVDVRGVKCIDLYLEYRMLLNHNHALAYGKQYIKGKVIETTPPPPKWERPDGPDADDEAHHKPGYSLAAATYKLLGVLIDTEEKNFIRDTIISSDRAAIDGLKYRILKYNESDIEYLPRLLAAIIETDCYYRHGVTKPTKGLLKEWRERALRRGDYAIRTAVMVTRGYPLDMAKIEKFTANVDKILLQAARECNAEAEGFEPFKWNRNKDAYSVNEKDIRAWVAKQGLPHWRKTDQGLPSLSKDAFGDWFDSRSEGFPGAFCRYLKTKQSLNGFLPPPPGSEKEVFADFVGSDNRARPYFGIFGSQSSRSQPGAKGFIPLKSHWMRNFIQPKPGLTMVGIDYASQEFLIAACMSQDEDMLAAYASGDVYTAFGVAAGIIPKGGTKKSHPVEREGCKATVLGISYDMTEYGLAPRLTRALGRTVTPDEARNYIDLFYETYSTYRDWKYEIQRQYAEDGYLELSDGWTMWGDNDNHRSVGNFPVQGEGAVILRRAVTLAEESGVRVLYTLHDAIYAEYRSFYFNEIEKLKNAMQKAFLEVMSTYGDTVPIRLEGETWSPDYSENILTGVENVVALNEYSDEKGKHDLTKYRKFFT